MKLKKNTISIYRRNGPQTKIVPSKTAAVQIGSKYFYQSGQISSKKFMVTTKIYWIALFYQYYSVLWYIGMLKYLKGCSFINFILGHEEILPGI